MIIPKKLEAWFVYVNSKHSSYSSYDQTMPFLCEIIFMLIVFFFIFIFYPTQLSFHGTIGNFDMLLVKKLNVSECESVLGQRQYAALRRDKLHFGFQENICNVFRGKFANTIIKSKRNKNKRYNST